jgi:hypothetical protein
LKIEKLHGREDSMAPDRLRAMWTCLASCVMATAGGAQDYSLMWPSSATMTECESATRCDAQWTFRGMKGAGIALSGAQFTLTVTAVGPKDFVIDRQDTKGPSVGLTARYTGHVVGDVVEGDVDWTWAGHWSKPAHGHWFASANEQDLRAALNRYQRQGTTNASGGASSDSRPGVEPTGEPNGFPQEGRTIIPTQATLTLSLAVDVGGNALVASLPGKRIVRIDEGGHALTVAGGGKEGVSSDETKTVLGTAYGFFAGPSGIGVDAANNAYTADFQEIRKFSLKSGRISNYPVPSLHQVPSVLGVDAAGDIYFSDMEGVHKYSAQGQSTGPIAPGISLKMRLDEIAGRFAVSQSGLVFFVDHGQLKEVSNGEVRMIRGGGTGDRSLSNLDGARGFAADTEGDLYFVNNQKLWKLQHGSQSLSLVSQVPESCPAIQLAAGKPGVLYAFCTGYVQRVTLP